MMTTMMTIVMTIMMMMHLRNEQNQQAGDVCHDPVNNGEGERPNGKEEERGRDRVQPFFTGGAGILYWPLMKAM